MKLRHCMKLVRSLLQCCFLPCRCLTAHLHFIWLRQPRAPKPFVLNATSQASSLYANPVQLIFKNVRVKVVSNTQTAHTSIAFNVRVLPLIVSTRMSTKIFIAKNA